ncbi:MAG: S8 family serine peptidase [Deltaproteobacteria bacterium]|nr:S8 family serine peptidase [Deltaproteobacteria bacterium]
MASRAMATAAPIDLAVACPASHQIGRNPSAGACPAAPDGRWKRSRVFQHSGASELTSFCVYDWQDNTTAPRVDRLPPGGWLSPECLSVTPYSHPYATRNAALLEAAFMAQIEAVALSPSPYPASKVVVVDTAVDGGFPNGDDGRSDHGRAVGAVVRNLACPSFGAGGGGCLADVATELATPMRDDGVQFRPDPAAGGFVGRPSDIAAAIHDGLHRALSGPPGAPIIINLSLGWDRRWGGSREPGAPPLSASLDAVHAALEEASCYGALVIAAAGNAPGGPDAEAGAAFPASWEREPAPVTARCLALGAPAPATGSATYRPLLYAISAVDGADEPLANERRGGRARLVAPGGHVTVSQAPSYRSETYSGSSMSAAATSAAAAAVWAYRPSLNAHEIMRVVFDSAVPLSGDSEVCLGGPPCADGVRRVSVCRAVAAACLASGACIAPVCGPLNPGRNLRPTGLDTSQPVATPYTFTGTVAHLPPAPCQSLVFGTDPTVLVNPCPERQYLSRYAVPYAVPQPPEVGCPNCMVKAGTLYIGISNDVDGVFTDPVLRVVRDDVEKTYALDGVGELKAGATIEVDVGSIEWDGVTKASIDFVHDGEWSTSDPLTLE